jgi:hypothetical protein
MPSIIARVPANGFQPSTINQENQIPNNNAIYTCFVLKAKIIATIGGITERNPYSIKKIIWLKVIIKIKYPYKLLKEEIIFKNRSKKYKIPKNLKTFLTS